MWKVIAIFLLALVPELCLGAVAFQIVIQRNMSCNGGEAAGALYVGGEEIARTLELPWRDNQNMVSRVPAGTYKARIRADGRLGWRVELSGVPNRTRVELHVGNYPRNTEGCVLVGSEVSSAGGTCALTGSAKGVDALRTAMDAASSDGVSNQPLDVEVVISD